MVTPLTGQMAENVGELRRDLDAAGASPGRSLDYPPRHPGPRL